MGHRYDLEVELQEVKVKLEKHQQYIVELETLLDAEVDAWENNVFDTRESEDGIEEDKYNYRIIKKGESNE